MKVNVQTHQVVLPPGASEAIIRRVERAFRRLHTQVANLDITLSRDSGDGQSGVCQLKVEFLQGGQVLVVERRRRLRSALTAAMKRGKHSAVKAMRRRRTQRRRLHTSASRMIEPVGVLSHSHT